jgi:DmsE family decaheme c-type cytochrome
MNALRRLIAGGGLFLLLMALPAFLASSADETDAAYAPAGAKSCLRCHDDTHIMQILNTPHAQRGDPRTPFAAHDCETCHGPSAEHMRKAEGETDRPSPHVVFGKKSGNSVEEQNGVCLGCHEGGIRMNWHASQHESADLACVSCHTIHVNKDPVLVKATQPEKCYTCHVEQKAQSFRRSHHPIREGQMACSDCHNPHGSFGPKMLVQASVNETCYTCHTEKRGPFLWEHPPVRDDCTNCHTPHGSTQERLLKVRAPFLCQQCHMETFHPSTLYSGTSVPPNGAGERLLQKACLNCHVTVHGSNHPSGTHFTR